MIDTTPPTRPTLHPIQHGRVPLKTGRQQRAGFLQPGTHSGKKPQIPPAHTNNLTQTTVQVSEELATQLSDTSLSPEVFPTRHAILDQNVRAKISSEAARLHGHTNDNNNNEGEGVDIVQREIEAALERENLDRERGMAGEADAETDTEGGAHGDIKNSTVLLGDLEEIRQKVEKYRERASLTDHLSVKEAREAVASCYQYVPPQAEPESLFHHCARAERIRQRHLIAGQKLLRFAVRWPSWSRFVTVFVYPSEY